MTRRAFTGRTTAGHHTSVTALAAGLLALAALTGCGSGTNDASASSSPTGSAPATTSPGISAPAASSTPVASSAPVAAQDPYALLPHVPALTVTSTSVRDGQPLPLAQMSGLFGVAGGKDQSPQLGWSAGPAGTKSYVVTMYDPDAPTGSGFWHWAVYDLPASAHSLPAGAGVPRSTLLPAGSLQAPNDAGSPRFQGAAPPKGSAPHHYYLTVTALDVARLDLPATASPALVGFAVTSHTLARGHIVGTAVVR